MNKKIKSLLQQAELYRTQGLLNEAQEKYKLIEDLIKKTEQIKNKEKLLEGIAKKMAALQKDVELVTSAPTTPEMSEHVNTLIKKLFSFSKDSESSTKEDDALEGAIALAKFGQFEGALADLMKLLEIDRLRVTAAKNILRCHLAIGSKEAATKQFSEWEAGDLFSSEQLEKVRVLLDDMVDKKVLSGEQNDDAVQDKASTADSEEDSQDEEEILDISAIAITFDSGPHKGEQVELDVSFQSGNIVSLIISSKDESLVESLNVGVKLEDVHFYSPIAIFRGSGVVSAMTQIKTGPKKGDYSLDIKIESI